MKPEREKEIRSTNELRKERPIVSSASYHLAIRDIEELLAEIDRLRDENVELRWKLCN